MCSSQRIAEFIANQTRHLAGVRDRLHHQWLSKLVACLTSGLLTAGKGWSCESSPDFNLFRLTKSYRLYILLTLLPLTRYTRPLSSRPQRSNLLTVRGSGDRSYAINVGPQ